MSIMLILNGIDNETVTPQMSLFHSIVVSSEALV